MSSESPFFTPEDSKEWFETWFDSPYYHILYQNRDDKEAEFFLDNLIKRLRIQPGAKVLDVACGKGRHALYLHRKGLDVTGFDLSAESISYDKQFENDSLNFYLHDMRHVFRVNYFDVVFNLFSSFGYFDSEHENIRCLLSNAASLRHGGLFVFDFLNAAKVRLNGNNAVTKKEKGIVFDIRKTVDATKVRKEIRFTDQGRNYCFEEKVALITRAEFEKYFQLAGLTIEAVYGSYALQDYNEQTSDRLILVARKG